MTNNIYLLTFVLILAILTILHIAYYLWLLIQGKKVVALPNDKEVAKPTLLAKTDKKLPEPKAQPLLEQPKEGANKNVFYTQSDNFQRIEGIGPAIEETLKSAGIRSYKQLAESDYSSLKSILMSKSSKFVMHDPRNWPKQAKLAQEGKWEELDKLKVELIRGK
jgi:predicted flap endonuclease-1-like 5' DNA nuclease